jgi:hypothetical protein
MMIDRKNLLLAASVALFAAAPVMAQEEPTAALAYYSIDNIILLLCAVLVLFMQAGFAALESGLSPVNNTVNIMFKNLTDLSVGVLLFYLVGYSIMYGDDASGGLGAVLACLAGVVLASLRNSAKHQGRAFFLRRWTGYSRWPLQPRPPPLFPVQLSDVCSFAPMSFSACL